MPKHPTFTPSSEEDDVKSSFKDSFQAKRCLVPAGGFYEWTKGEDGEPKAILFRGLFVADERSDAAGTREFGDMPVQEPCRLVGVDMLHHRLNGRLAVRLDQRSRTKVPCLRTASR